MTQTKKTNSTDYKKMLQQKLKEEETKKYQLEIVYQRTVGAIEQLKNLIDGIK